MIATISSMLQTTTPRKPDPAGAAIGGVMLVFLIIGGAIVFFVPTGIAVYRKHHNTMPIVLVNVLGGLFCGIGWIVALIWSLTSPAPPSTQTVIVHQGGQIGASTAAAGWYPDGAGRQRWWDGNGWTEHYQ